MSTSRGSGGAGNEVQQIPAGSRKMVQNLKEIVNCTEAEIYATLKECNMDPNKAVDCLLYQDTFHEVKRKREKKKEGKDTGDSRPRGANSSSTRGGRSGAGRGGSTSYYSSESAPVYSKPSYKKENGSTPYTSASYLVPATSGNNRSRGPSGLSDDSYAYKGSSLVSADGIPSSVQPSSGQYSAWAGVPGQVSMADIVKMGRPQNKAASASHNIGQGLSTSSHHNLRYSDDYASKGHESEFSSVQHAPVIDEWPSMPTIERPASSKVTSVPEYSVDSHLQPEAPVIPFDSVNRDSEAEEEQELGDDNIDESGANDVGSHSFSSRKISDDDARGASQYENDLYEDGSSYQPQVHDFEHHQVEEVDTSVLSVTRNLQQLSVENDDRGLSSNEDTPAPSVVIIPDHLQVQSADCSHLSFGSFGSGLGVQYSSGTSVPVNTNLEEPHSEADIPSAGHTDTRNSEYYVDDSLRNASDGSLFHRTGASAGSYDASSPSRPEELKPENIEVAHGSQYHYPSSNSGYTFNDNQQHSNAAFNQTSSEAQNLAQFSNIMSYTNSLPSSLLAANVHPSRESELQYSQLSIMQAMALKYGNAAASMGVSGNSMGEALNTAQNAPQNLSGTNVANGHSLPQQLVHPYSQPTLPLGPYTNMIGYPFMPPHQSYTYVPSAFQQAYAGSNYHQSLAAAAVLPQYKNSASVSNLPQSAAIASGYGGFGNTTAIPGNFSMNPPAAPSATSINYDDVLSSQYKDNSHLMSLQQNENPAMWPHGANSRTMSAIPANTYYNYQGQTQQQQQQPGGGFRQGQQPSQNYGNLGYPNFYHSQAGMSHEQQQNSRDGSLGGPQGQPKPSQIWQNGGY